MFKLRKREYNSNVEHLMDIFKNLTLFNLICYKNFKQVKESLKESE